MGSTPQNQSPEAPVLAAEPPPYSLPADYGDVRAEFAALVSGCASFDLSARAKIRLTGSDQIRWLNGMVTNNIRDLAANHGVYAFLLNPQGRILGDLYAYNRGGSLLLDIHKSQLEKLLAIFDKYIIMDDVEVANVSDQLSAIGFAGPDVRRVLKTAGLDVPALKTLEVAELAWNSTQVSILRGDNPNVESYELWLAPEQLTSVRDALVNAGARPAGTTATELLRIASGVPRYGQDIRERDLPQETSQERALHFAKGCYVGQEIVERIRSRGAVHRQFAGFEIRASDRGKTLPEAGTKFQVDGKDVGEITSVASLPTVNGERAVALGYIRREFGNIGKQVFAGDTELTVASLPFVTL
jgi:folate-binding protein YgfZ